MDLCFTCNQKLYGKRTLVCSIVKPHVTYPDIIANLLGDVFVVIANSTDQICPRCAATLTKIDKFESELKSVKKEFLSHIQNNHKHSIQAVEDVEGVNGQLKAEEHLGQGQIKLKSGRKVKESHTVTTAATSTPIKTPLKTTLKLQQNHYSQMQIPKDEGNKNMMFQCRFCELPFKKEHVRNHLNTCPGRQVQEKPIVNQAAAKALTLVPQSKKQVYKCYLCAKTFDKKQIFIEHFKNHHNQPTASTSKWVPQSKIQVYKCQVCAKSFEKNEIYLEHIKNHHNQPTASTSKWVPQSKIQVYKCQVCAKSFEKNEIYLEHIKNHYNQPTASTSKWVPQSEKQVYKCQVCAKSFEKKEIYLEHFKKHFNQPTASTSKWAGAQ